MNTLFRLPSPTLLWVLEDAATSDNPLEIHMQRKGWTEKALVDIPASIAEKLTIDLFSKETEPLSALELTFQRDVQEFLDKQ